MLKTQPNILLASKSPRRQELLKAAGIQFQTIDIDVEETYPDDMEAENVPEFLARKKAEAAFHFLKDGDLILAADSVVIMNDEIYGKPGDRQHAIDMISALAGHKHLVVTGVFLCDHHDGLGFSEHTYVWFSPMTMDEIEYYVDQYKPFDKAGAYGIQDWIGLAKVSRIEGSYSNVMGLPVQRVYEELQKWTLTI
ncbi:MAG TPA: Maf family protein [Saprospiraceae bacterium]|nr:Maf family protein [Saprospiraceae bacterium]